MKILIVVNSLQQGGAERAAIRLAESFYRDGQKVVLATWNSTRDFYKLDKNIERINLTDVFISSSKRIPLLDLLVNKIRLIVNLQMYRRQILREDPDVVICFESLIGSITGISLLGKRIPLIISERVNPNPSVYKPHKIATVMRPKLYRFKAICSVQTKGFAEWVIRNWRILPVITPNHIPDDWLINKKIENEISRKVISIGRVEPQKGFDVLLHAWRNLGNLTDGWQLEIYGSQNNKAYLAELDAIATANVSFYNARENIQEILDESTILVSSSRFEGFPNVVLEAAARGIPIIASVSTDIIDTLSIENALMSYEPEDVTLLQEHMTSLILNDNERIKFSIAAQKASKNYTWDKIGVSWYFAIEKAKEQKQRRIRWTIHG
jgi:GalNAc-alpha-(1->4)-GalNAc-alpha-(1->3)-diNAcBac-PP-undecaprenol alpha-1,4-N-acetyl-D-galactosaminyltransferase